jgi:hypothetical protein
MIAIQSHGVAKIVNRVPQRGQKTPPGALIDLQFRQIIAAVSAFHLVSLIPA